MTPLAVFLDMALAEVVVALSRSLVANGTGRGLGLTAALNGTSERAELSFPAQVAVAVVLGSIISVMVVGNLFVILAILVERDLQRPQYYLILSLGVADLMVGVVVSPLASVYEVERSWRLGVGLCDFWISADVLACTSSILHLVAIAIDRYSSITDIMYSQRRTPRRIGGMLAVVWVTSALISVAPILGWKDAHFNHRVLFENQCLISQDLGYQLFSTVTAFYGPLVLIVVIYYKIFRAARQRIRKGRQKRMSTAHTLTSSTIPMDDRSTYGTPTTAVGNGAGEAGGGRAEGQRLETSSSRLLTPSTPGQAAEAAEGEAEAEAAAEAAALAAAKKSRSKESAEAKRERKAWRTLAIITGTFVGSWLPFFILAVARPICARSAGGGDEGPTSTTSTVAPLSDTSTQGPSQGAPAQPLCHINPAMESVFLWLGYMNSALNPIIYTIFSPDFRGAFKRIIRRLCFLS